LEAELKASIISIGNSRGIRIPKAVLDQCGFEDTVEIEVADHRLVLSAPVRVRAGWDEAFKKMAAKQDEIPFEPIPTDFEQGEWEW
jgi:antitoxin MazE